MLKALPALATALIAVSACSSSADIAAAEREVTAFHRQLDQGQYAEIYDASAQEFKRASTQADFVALLEAVHRKLGDSQSAARQNWNVNFQTSGTFVTVLYKTVYAQGGAEEQFVYRVDGQSALLVGYHINSNTLIIK